MRKQLTGEPVAGELHSGFGGRGRRAPFPTPISVTYTSANGAVLAPPIAEIASSSIATASIAAHRTGKRQVCPAISARPPNEPTGSPNAYRIRELAAAGLRQVVEKHAVFRFGLQLSRPGLKPDRPGCKRPPGARETNAHRS